MAGHIDLTFDQAITALPHVRSGQVKAYAVTSDKRLAAAPDIPTVDEAGAPGVYISTWYGMWVPKGTPQEAIRKLTAAAMDALADPAVRERGSPASARRSRRASSRPRRRSPLTTRPRSKNGGR